jgi:hypothetical protein
MNPTQQPHVSDAIRQVRSWVTIACAVLAICCATQMLVYAFAAYTDCRWDEVKAPRADKPLRVVGAPAAGAPADQHVAGGVRTNLADTGPSQAARVPSSHDLLMRRLSDAASGAGLIASLTLAILTMMGVAIAGGGCVPGVERVTTSCVWSIVIGLLCLPWSRLLPGMGVPGIFASYADMAQAIDSRSIGGASVGSFALTMQWVGAPLLAMFTVLGVAFWFRAGVERGIIVTAPSEFDRAVEREVAMIQKRGVASSTPKAVGALNRAIGSAVENADSADPDADLGITRRRPQRGVADGDFKRPI